MTLNSSQVGTEWVNKTQNQNSCTVCVISTIIIVIAIIDVITPYHIIVIIIIIIILVLTIINGARAVSRKTPINFIILLSSSSLLVLS